MGHGLAQELGAAEADVDPLLQGLQTRLLVRLQGIRA
jgi:hypothetical protein